MSEAFCAAHMGIRVHPRSSNIKGKFYNSIVKTEAPLGFPVLWLLTITQKALTRAFRLSLHRSLLTSCPVTGCGLGQWHMNHSASDLFIFERKRKSKWDRQGHSSTFRAETVLGGLMSESLRPDPPSHLQSSWNVSYPTAPLSTSWSAQRSKEVTCKHSAWAVPGRPCAVAVNQSRCGASTLTRHAGGAESCIATSR